MSAPPSGGPPKKEAAPLPSRTATTNNDDQSTNPAGGLRRRCAAAKRIAGGDPWPAEYAPVPLTEHQLDMWRLTVEHLEAEGFTPLVGVEVCRALWRRGGADRALAERLHHSDAGVVA